MSANKIKLLQLAGRKNCCVHYFKMGILMNSNGEIISNFLSFNQCQSQQRHTCEYIFSHYNPSVRIIDLVPHNTYIVCVNFIHKWLDLQFKVDSERKIFWESFSWQFYFSLRVFAKNLLPGAIIKSSACFTSIHCKISAFSSHTARHTWNMHWNWNAGKFLIFTSV